jgi:hypothetical protein
LEVAITFIFNIQIFDIKNGKKFKKLAKLVEFTLWKPKFPKLFVGLWLGIDAWFVGAQQKPIHTIVHGQNVILNDNKSLILHVHQLEKWVGLGLGLGLPW